MLCIVQRTMPNSIKRSTDKMIVTVYQFLRLSDSELQSLEINWTRTEVESQKYSGKVSSSLSNWK